MDTRPASNFAARPSGLIVPKDRLSDAAIGQQREIWGRTHWRIVDRAMAFLAQKGIGVLVACTTCRQPIKRWEDADGLHLECPHLDRLVRRPAGKGFRRH